jgi:hypothetical protein
MDLIEISNGIILDADKIEAIIESVKDNKPVCKIYISGISYPCKLSKAEILKRIITKGVRKGKSAQEQVLNIMKQTTNMGG